MNIEKLRSMLEKDPYFIENYTIYHPEVENDLNSATSDMWDKIKNLEIHERPYGFFAIDRNTDIINWIVGFFVLPEYRKNNSLIEDIEKETNKLFMVAISNTNKKALNYMNRYCNIISKDKEKTIFCFRGR